MYHLAIITKELLPYYLYAMTTEFLSFQNFKQYQRPFTPEPEQRVIDLIWMNKLQKSDE